MVCVSRGRRRRGATVVECAIVYPITFLLLLGLIIGGLGVFRYQEIASVSREGARWASVNGGQCVREANPLKGSPTLTAAGDVYTNAIKPQSDAANLDPPSLTYTVSWADASQNPTYYDYTNSAWRTNTVTVTVKYQWIPEAYLGGITFTSTSVMPITY
jgi:Flp pilus assembly protein TadG